MDICPLPDYMIKSVQKDNYKRPLLEFTGWYTRKSYTCRVHTNTSSSSLIRLEEDYHENDEDDEDETLSDEDYTRQVFGEFYDNICNTSTEDLDDIDNFKINKEYSLTKVGECNFTIYSLYKGSDKIAELSEGLLYATGW